MSSKKRPINSQLTEFIRDKQKYDNPLSAQDMALGFRGWHERGYLPHLDLPNVTQFVTFMLIDSFLITRGREWAPILNESDESQRRRRLEACLHRGHASCWMRQRDIADVVEASLRQHDGKLFQLKAWIVMPNHVHVIVDVWTTPLSRILNRWKGASANAANRLLQRSGAFWQPDFMDTLIRDADH